MPRCMAVEDSPVMKFQTDHDATITEPFELPSMVDLVFILLSFFILATQLRILERDFTSGYQPQEVPQAVLAEDLPASIPVELRSVPGGVAIRMGHSPLGINRFDAIREALTEINLPATPVVLSADGALSVDQVARALDAVLASPMRNVSLSLLGGAAE
jgi:biopolymer transport protein ExbD